MPKTCSVDGCERQHQARGYCTIHYSQWQRSQPGYNEQRRLKRQDRKVPINCELCGKTKLVTVQHANVQRFCSLACAARGSDNAAAKHYKRRVQRGHYIKPEPKPPQPKPRGRRNPIPNPVRAFKSGQCRICSNWYVALNNDVTCSPECWAIEQRNAKRMYRSRRRALKSKAFVANVYRKKIFERDKYRCQLKLPGCQGIDKNKVVPHPKAPTEDHIIPLSKGGTHEPANVHTACFYCNAHKSDRGGGEQLALIG